MNWLKWLLLALAAVTLIWFFNQEKPLQVTWQHPDIGSVETIVANTRSGTVESCQRAKMSFAIGGQIEKIHVVEGELVKQGDLLMTLWQQDRLARVSEAQALIQSRIQQQKSICINAVNDKKTVKRYQRLLNQKLIAQETLDNALAKADASAAACLSAKSEVDVAKALKQTAKASLAQTELYAPFDGMVAEITGELGEFATPSPTGIVMPPAIDILTHDCHYVTAPIDEVDAGQLSVGMPVKITIDAYEQQQFSGTIQRISPYVQDYAKQARTVDVDVSFDNSTLTNVSQLLTGYSTDIAITVAKIDQTLRLPSELIVDEKYVYILDNEDVIRKKEIETGLSNWQFTQVTSGLSSQDKVISSLAISGLKDGQVAIAEQESAQAN
ncbi:efflux RND transporter periplasmic adaptor subunit [Thalassotalea ponticola]|uniref:efflux RND transporter periplasmic adaptor subunit n=1 Tax=Thalassotalea ponticola TaxID=1523392 RepID=UPI0025B2B438|nr:efflux RND transporter periplasmic adaptor subunit [Thalassotalea ponticola]MDN3652342.1 efflux RND transporter periplasmic adaptor subunit [Thalassotalea ponticola]